MGIFSKLISTSDLPDTTKVGINDTIVDGETISFTNVNEETARKVVALQSGIDLIANAISTLPCYLYRRNKDGERVKVDDYRNYLLNASPSETVVASNLKYNIVKNLILKGNSYTLITYDKLGKVKELLYLKNVTVGKVKLSDGTVNFKYSFTLNDKYMTVNHHEMINIIKDNDDSCSYKGRGVLEKGMELLNIAASENKYAYSSLNGVNVKGYLSKDTKLSSEAKENLKESWKKFYTGADKTSTPILEEGLEFKQLNLKPAEIELLQSRQFTIKQIAMLLNIPFSYLVDSASSYNNSAEEALRFLRQTLSPYIRLMEENFNKYLLTEKEKGQGYFFEFDTQEILRVSVKEQIDYLDKATKGGLMTLAESRRKLNLPYIEGTDILLVPVNMGVLSDGDISPISSDRIDKIEK